MMDSSKVKKEEMSDELTELYKTDALNLNLK